MVRWLQQISLDALDDLLWLSLEFEKSEEKKAYFDQKMNERIIALLLGLNGVKIHMYREFS